MGTSTMQFARNTSHTAICQVKPWSSMELAMVYVGTHTTMPTHSAA